MASGCPAPGQPFVVKLCDFGFSRLGALGEGDHSGSERLEMNTLVGSAPYMAPELLALSEGKTYDGRVRCAPRSALPWPQPVLSRVLTPLQCRPDALPTHCTLPLIGIPCVIHPSPSSHPPFVQSLLSCLLHRKWTFGQWVSFSSRCSCQSTRLVHIHPIRTSTHLHFFPLTCACVHSSGSDASAPSLSQSLPSCVSPKVTPRLTPLG
jgi:serine/threonine protein kinase